MRGLLSTEWSVKAILRGNILAKSKEEARGGWVALHVQGTETAKPEAAKWDWPDVNMKDRDQGKGRRNDFDGTSSSWYSTCGSGIIGKHVENGETQVPPQASKPESSVYQIPGNPFVLWRLSSTGLGSHWKVQVWSAL